MINIKLIVGVFVHFSSYNNLIFFQIICKIVLCIHLIYLKAAIDTIIIFHDINYLI